MILRSLELGHFGKFSERTFEFRHGLNLVVGPNEAGKSTLMEAIPAVLFGVRDKERYRPWGQKGSCEAALLLEEGDRSVRIARDLLTDRVELVERDDLYHVLYRFEGKAAPRGRSSDRAEYRQQLFRLLGIDDEDIFRASLFFGQGSLEFPGENHPGERIKTLLSGFTEVDYDRVLESLREDYFTLTRSNPWGKDKSRNRQLEEVRERLGELEKRWYRAREAYQELARLREAIAALEEEIERDRGEYQKGEKYLAWVRRKWHLEEREETLRRDFERISRETQKVAELERDRQKIEEQLAETGLPRHLPEDLAANLTEAEKIRGELIETQKQAVRLRGELLELAPVSRKWPVSATVLLLAAAGGTAAWRPEVLPWVLGAAVLTLMVGWGLWSGWNRKIYQRRRRLKAVGRKLEQKREQAQQRLDGLDEKFENLELFSSGVEIDKLRKKLDRHRDLTAELGQVESALKVLENSAALNREKTELTQQLAVVDERRDNTRSEMPEGILTPEELPEAETKMQELAESIRVREKDLVELSRREAALQGELGDLPELEEEGERLRELESTLERRQKALRLGTDLLTGAVEEFRATYMERFAAEIGKYLGRITRGRYPEVCLEDDFAIFLKEGPRWQPLSRFSRGTRDAAWLAVRMALTRHLCRGRQLPLLLDDPLVNLDRQRLGDTLQAGELLSSEHQVILFSHLETLTRRAARDRWHVISLERQRKEPPAAQERREDVGQLYLL